MRVRDFAEIEAELAEARQTIKTLSDQANEQAIEIAGMHHQLRRAGSAEVALRNELNKLREEEPESDDIRELLHLWRDEVKGGSKRVSVRLDGDRAKRVKWALKRYSKDRIADMIMGATLDDWAMGRNPRTNGREFNDIAKHILGSEDKAEEFENRWLNRGKPEAQPVVRAPQRSTIGPPPPGDPVDRLLERLDGVKPAGLNTWTAKCPAHDDRQASLSVSAGRDGALAHCFAGCTAEEIALAIGVPLAHWFDHPEDLRKRVTLAVAPDPLPTATEMAAWTAALLGNDALLARLTAVKAWKADVLEHHGVGWDSDRRRLVLPVRDGRGGLINAIRYVPGGTPKSLAIKGRPRDLFPAPESVGGHTIWIVEGEPDALTAASIGLPAVGLPGADNWKPAWAHRFAGRDVVVCCDCDAPGRKAAAGVAESLTAEGVACRVVDLDPARDDKYDLGDFVMGGGTLADLHALADVRSEAA